jgi:HD-like signal output (HDOD) protein
MGAARKIPTEELVQKLDDLPTLPTVVHELSALINDPMSSTTDIERVMEKDQSLTAKVLKLINSAYYAIPGGVSSLSRAIAYLGFDTIHQLILSTSIFKSFNTEDKEYFDVKKFWQHSVGVAMVSETIAKYINYSMPSDLFTVGLVHDIGKVALSVVAPEQLIDVAKHAAENGMSTDEAERDLDVPRHTYIGNLLAAKWKLPVQMQNGIMYHHQMDARKRGGVSPQLNQVIDIVIMANLLIHAIGFGHSGHDKKKSPPKVIFERLSISDEDIKKLSEKIKETLSNADAFLRIIGED